MFISSMTATFKRNFVSQVRAYPMSFFIGNLLTALYSVLSAWFMYHLLFEGALDTSFKVLTGTADYISYVIIGSAVYALAVRTCLNVSRSLITELREGTLESLMLTPFNRYGYFIGNMLQQTVTSIVEVSIALIICMPFGFNPSSFSPLHFLIALVVSLYAFFGMSMMLGALMLYTRDTYISQNTLFVFMFLVSGVLFPSDYLPKYLNAIGRLIPLGHALDVIRASIIEDLSGEGSALFISNIHQLLMFGSVYIIAGFFSLKRIERIALEKIFG